MRKLVPLRVVQLSLAWLVLAGLAARTYADETPGPWWRPLAQRCPCCPDDYCRKKLPPAPCPAPCGGPNDYCRKPLPLTCPQKCFGVNDYCRKPLPIVTPCYPEWYTCGPPSCAPPVPAPRGCIGTLGQAGPRWNP